MNGNTAQQTFSLSRAGRVRGWTRTLLVDLVAQVVAVVVLQIRLGEEQVRAGRVGVQTRAVLGPRQQAERRERGEQRLQLHRRHGLTAQPGVQRVRGEPARARGDVLEELNVQGGEERL